MSNIIDSKVVEMEFDNKRFEENVNTSISSLDKLKQSLKLEDAAKGFNNLDKAAQNVDFNKMARSLEFLEKRFSVMGIVGMRVIENLTDSVMGFVHNTLGAALNQIKTGGIKRAMSIENARFQLQGLISDQNEVNAIMKDALDSVDGTAYAYDAAALAASQFAASGMHSGEQMYGALRAITGVAAMTNSEYENISRIFTTVAGNGRLMGDQLLQLSSRGLNAASAITTYFNDVNKGTKKASAEVQNAIYDLTGGLQITEGQLRDLVSKGEISFAVFAEAMDQSFGEHAKKANDTLTGAFSNVKAALSRIGAEFIQPLVGQKSTIVQFLNTLRVQINGIKSAIIPMARVVSSSILHLAELANTYLSGLDLSAPFRAMSESVWEIGRSILPIEILRKKDIEALNLTEKELKAFGKVLVKTAKANNVSISGLNDDASNWVDTLDQCWLSADIFRKSLDSLGKAEADAAKQTGKSLEEIRKTAKEVIRGDWGNGQARIDALKKAGFDPEVVQKYVNIVHDLGNGTWNLSEANIKAADTEIDKLGILQKLSKEQLKSLGYTKEEIESIHQLNDENTESGKVVKDLTEQMTNPIFKLKILVESVANVGAAIAKVFGAAKTAFDDVFGGDSEDVIGNAILAFNTFSKRLIPTEKTVEKIVNVFRGLFTVITTVKNAIWGLTYITIPPIYRILESVAYLVLTLVSMVGDFIYKLKNSEREIDVVGTLFEILAGVLDSIASSIANAIVGFADFIHDSVMINGILDLMVRLFGSLKRGADNVAKLLLKIFDPIKKRANGLLDVLQNIWNIASTAFSGLISIFKEFASQINLTDVLTEIGFILAAVGVTIVDTFAQGVQAVSDFANELKNLNPDEIKERVIGVFQSIVNYFGQGQFLKDITSAFDSIGQKVAEFETNFHKQIFNVTTDTTKFGDGFKKLAEVLKGFVENVDGGNVMAVIAAIFAFMEIKNLPAVVKKIGNYLSGIDGIIFTFQDVLTAFAGTLSHFNKVLDGIAFSLKLKALTGFLLSLVAVIGAFIVVGYLAQKGLINIDAVTALLLSLTACIVIVAGVAKKVSGKQLLGAALLVAAMGAVLFAIALAFKIISSIENPVMVLESLAVIGGIIAIMAWAIKYMSTNINIKGDWKTAVATLVGFAIAIKVVVWALADIAKLNKKYGSNMGVALGELVVIMGLLIGAFKVVTMESKGTGEAALALVGIAVSVLLFIRAIEKLAKTPGETIVLGLVKLLPILVVIGLIFFAIKKVGGDAVKTGIFVLSIGVAINLIAFALKSLSDLVMENPAGLLAAMVVLTILFIEIGVFLTLVKTTSRNADKAGLMILGISASLILIALAMKIMSTIDPGQMLATTIAIGLIFLALSQVIKASRFTTKDVKTLATIGVIIAILAASLAILSMIKPERLLPAAISLGMVMFALTAMIKVVADASNKLNWKGVISSLVLMGVALVLVGGALFAMQKLTDTSTLLPIAESMSLILISIAAALGILAKLNVTPDVAAKAGLAFDIFALIIAGLAGAFVALDELSGHLFGEMLDKGSVIMEKFGHFIGSFFSGVLDAIIPKKTAADKVADMMEMQSLLITVKSFGDVLSDVDASAFTKFGDLARAIKDIAEANIMQNIARIMGGDPGSAIDAFSAAMPNLAKALGEFYDAIKPYDIDDATIDSATRMLSGLAQMSKNDIGASSGLITAITGNKAKDMLDFGMKLDYLAIGLCNFFLRLKSRFPEGIDEGVVTSATTLLSGLAKMSKNDIGASSGLIAGLAGNTSENMKKFGENLIYLGTGLADFYTAMQDKAPSIDKSKVDQYTKMLSGLGQMAKVDIPSEGNAFFGFVKDPSIQDFSTNLLWLGRGLALFYNAVRLNTGGKIDTKLMNNATKILKDIAVISNENISTDGGLGGIIFGTNKEGLSGFAGNLEGLGKGISSFAQALGDDVSDTSRVDSAVYSLKKIAELIENEAFKHELTANTFGINLGKIAQAFRDFGTNVEILDTAKLAVINEFIAELRFALNAMSQLDPADVDKAQGVLDQIAALTIEAAAEAIQNGETQVVGAIDEFYNHLSTSIRDVPDLSSDIGAMIQSIANQVTSNGEILGSVGSSLGAKLANGIKNGIKSAGAADGASSAMSSSLAAVNSQASQFSSAGKSAVSNLVSGIASGTPTIVATFKSAITSSLTTVKGQTGAFNNTGRDLVRGLTNGISADSYKVAAKAKAMAEAAVKAARAALQVKSPSRVFYEIGEYVVRGFANALGDGVSDAYTSSYEMAISAKAGMTRALSNMSELIDANVDTSPVIRPVMDLSEIQSGVSAMDGMLTTNPMFGVPDNLGAVNAMMMFRSKSATNDDVVSAINALKKNLGDARGDSVVINGITYDDGSNINDAVRALIRAARVERRA